MKRILLFILMILVVVSLVSCGGKGNVNDSPASESEGTRNPEEPTLEVSEEMWRASLTAEGFHTVSFVATENGVTVSKGIFDGANNRLYGHSETENGFQEFYQYIEQGESKVVYRVEKDGPWLSGSTQLSATQMAERMAYLENACLATKCKEPLPDLSSLYASFTFDEKGGVYHGTVTVKLDKDGSTQEDTRSITLSFADGHLMMIESVSSLTGERLSYNFSAYGTAKVILPEELDS